jgi:hypothetical protein
MGRVLGKLEFHCALRELRGVKGGKDVFLYSEGVIRYPA